MARPITLEQARSLRPPASLVRQASAAQFPRTTPRGTTQALTLPQASNPGLWYWYYNSPEVWTVAQRIGAGVSRVAFMPCVNIPGSPGDRLPPLVDQDGNLAEGIPERLARDCAEIWATVQSPSGPQSEIFAQLAICMAVAGDGWQFGWTADDDLSYNPDGMPSWMGLARPALEKVAEGYRVNVGAQFPIDVPYSVDGGPGGTAIRVWQPDPSAPAQASSWVQAVLPHLNQLNALYEAAAASALSRMNAGIILAPSDQDMDPVAAAALTSQGMYPPGTDLTETLYGEIADHVEASQTEGLNGYSRVVPAVVGMNSQLTDKVKWLELSRQIDPGIKELVQELRYELTIAAPSPPELILGLGQTNHWNGEQIDEDEYQSSILPACERVAYSNTRYLLREGLKQRNWGQTEIDRVCIGFTARFLLTPPDRTEPAIKIMALDQPQPALSNTELRELAGMGEFEGPDDDETYRSTVLWLAGKNSAYAPLLETIGFDTSALGQPMPAPAEPVVEDEPEDAEIVETKAITRQAAARPEGDVDLGYRLVGYATRYEEQLSTLFAAIIARMTERASTRVASAARKWARTPDLRDAVATAKPHMVGMVPGLAPKLQAEGIDDDDLFAPALAAFAAQFQTLTEKTQRRAVRDIGGDWPSLAPDADEANAAAWALTGTLLIAEARRRFEGALLPSLDGEGALSPFGIPSAIISRVSAVAGGQLDAIAGGVNTLTTTVPWKTITTGRLSTLAAQQAEKVVVGYLWDYRGAEIERTPFPPHEDLDGQFGYNEDDWDGGFYVGDHAGCCCATVPVYAAI